LFANTSAQAALAANSLRLVEGVLSLRDDSSRSARLIASCDGRAVDLQGPGGSFQVSRGPRRPALRVLVSPFDAGIAAEATWLGPRRAVAMVMLKDPELDRLRFEQRLRRRFALTAAEAALAVEIAQGDGREAAAARRGVSITTVRAQLSSIFAKMGIRRQAELVRVVLGED
jgi:DNA-binding CsgD family transcriptional regulator